MSTLTRARRPKPVVAKTRLPFIGPTSAGIPMTTDEFDAIEEYDDNYDYELINGVLVVSPIPSNEEASPNDELGFLIRLYKHQHPEGKCIDETVPERYVITKNRRKADRVIWIGLGRVPDEKVDVPTVIAEFVSQGKRNWVRDYETKREEYRAIRVQEYWIFDRFQRTLTVYRLSNGDSEELVIREDQFYRTPLLPGFEVPVGRLLALADKWEKKKAKGGRS